MGRCSTGSSSGSSPWRRGGRHNRHGSSVPAAPSGREPRSAPGRRGVHRARRRARLLGVVRDRRADGPLPPDLDARPFARLEGPDRVLRASFPRGLLRPARQWPLRPAAGAVGLRRERVRAGRARRDGRLRRGPRGRRHALQRRAARHAPRRRAPRESRGDGLHRTLRHGRPIRNSADACPLDGRRDEGPSDDARVGQVQPRVLGRRRVRRLRPVVGGEDAARAALDEADRGRRRLVARDRRRDAGPYSEGRPGGAAHAPQVRKPVQVNLAVREFVDGTPRGDPTVHRSDGRKRALYISSPIGLGHAQRDVAIARELRGLVDGLEIDWLAQDPVTRVLEADGERIHPGSEQLANESRHMESESAEHDLHCFQAWRRMDEILINNFMVFHDVAREERYDLWVGDEAWELDYYLHENPREKRARYAWLTDFVGWLPMPDGGDHEAYLTADYNAEMVEHIDAHPTLRDRAIFVGNPDDIVDERLGPQLPMIRDWTERNFEFAGYVTGFDPRSLGHRDELRDDLGYRPDEKVCIVSVGGSGVGADLLRRVIASFEGAKRQGPELRMIVVAGPRIDPDSLPQPDGLEIVAYVHNLYRHLAACDLAVVQGGLTTAMELTAGGRPFLYFPLRHHFEQNMHVAHRLHRYGAGRRMDFDTAEPDVIAGAIAEEIGRPVDYREVETDGARRAAEKLAELL